MAADRPLGIFCVEGSWSESLTDRASVRELLQLLEDVAGIDFIHHHVGGAAELFDVLRRWSRKRYARYALGYFAFHGRPGRILVGREEVSLEELGDVLRDRARDRILYFGSCSVLRAPETMLDAFCSATGSPCVVGYTRDVDWVASAAFDLILLQAIALLRDPNAARRSLEEKFGGLAGALGLKVY